MNRFLQEPDLSTAGGEVGAHGVLSDAAETAEAPGIREEPRGAPRADAGGRN